MQTTTRNATLEDLAKLLQKQHARKLDVVVPAPVMRSEDAKLVITGSEALISDDGVTQADGVYTPTEICDGGIADKLGIPAGYLGRLRAQRPDLYDANVNGWLHGHQTIEAHGPTQVAQADPRSFLVRCFRGDEGQEGIARAFLSNGYGIVDNLDVLMAALDGVRQAGVEINIAGCDLTERRMSVRVIAPQVHAYADTLLEGYRSPFGPNTDGGVGSTVFAGFVIGNSETGGGATSITPRIQVLACSNGITFTKDAYRSIHLGARMEEGVVRWSNATQQKALELITAKTRDAVATFLDVEYVKSRVAELEQSAGKAISNPADTVRDIGRALSFTETQQATILDHFIRGGQMTAGGVLQAVTSAAQVQEDADAAYRMEDQALAALELAAQ